MRLLEAQIEKSIVRYAEGNGWLVRKIIYPGRKGCPDRMFIKDGRVLFVEFKRPGEKPRGTQKNEHARFRNHGVEVYVIDDIDVGKLVFQ